MITYENKNKNKAFTVIELVVVIGILAALSVIIISNIFSYDLKAKTAATPNAIIPQNMHASFL